MIGSVGLSENMLRQKLDGEKRESRIALPETPRNVAKLPETEGVVLVIRFEMFIAES